jgi:hypothetical protein
MHGLIEFIVSFNRVSVAWGAIRCFFIIIISGVGLRPLGTAATSGLLYKP